MKRQTVQEQIEQKDVQIAKLAQYGKKYRKAIINLVFQVAKLEAKLSESITEQKDRLAQEARHDVNDYQVRYREAICYVEAINEQGIALVCHHSFYADYSVGYGIRKMHSVVQLSTGFNALTITLNDKEVQWMTQNQATTLWIKSAVPQKPRRTRAAKLAKAA